ncbi:hypothetical protein H6G06_26160 [Anabaena sphaerica FACHB-251]|jgi:hypothetical protein|uniref:Uncharacterized protein n=1 Tax=Anabaena sphaerica FACHB-251 TaxID=2692883 RepID=A0A926WLL6_9NOST|nr:hypothetical protein [Anabaena sphaerica]MBD2296865.1 hypothetical protein [Anabaena sphaerica FACHB-251]
MKIKGNWGCIHWWISALATAITINYLARGFVDIVLNINSLLEWLQKSGVGEFIYRLLGGR